MRNIWCVSPRTHCRLLEHLYGSSGIEYDLLFYHYTYKGKNQCTCLCLMLYKTSMTPVAMNRRQLCAKLNIAGECLNEIN